MSVCWIGLAGLCIGPVIRLQSAVNWHIIYSMVRTFAGRVAFLATYKYARRNSSADATDCRLFMSLIIRADMVNGRDGSDQSRDKGSQAAAADLYHECHAVICTFHPISGTSIIIT